MFELGVKFFDLGVNSFGLDVNPDLGQVDQTFFAVCTDAENVDFCKENPMTAFMRV